MQAQLLAYKVETEVVFYFSLEAEAIAQDYLAQTPAARVGYSNLSLEQVVL